MKNNKYKILVLADLNNNAKTTIKSSIGLAKMIDAEIEVFSVKKASEIVRSDNQLSAMRSISERSISLRDKMKNLIEPLSKQYDIRINSSYSMGNIKEEIGHYIDTKKPDIVVLGKRREKVIKLIGDRITPFILSKFKGVIMIANEKNIIEPNKEISLGLLNDLESSFNLEFAEDLIKNTQKPLKSFKIAQNSSDQEVEQRKLSTRKTVEYVFEQGDGALRNISNYLTKSKTDILYVDRFKKRQDRKTSSLRPDINDIVNKLNVTLLVTGENNFDLQ